MVSARDKGCCSQLDRANTLGTPPMFMRLPAVLRETALSRSSLYAEIKEGRFPSPVRISVRSVAWRSEDIDAWKSQRPIAIEQRSQLRQV
ncbi:MAG: AlpA family phage regulatory protein [Alphaproteobacteria bacterium]